jgi:hypothetical protein
MTRALLLAILLVATADAGPFSRSRSYNNDYNRQPSQVLASRITGNVDELPPEPEFYTVAVFPENYGTNPDSQELLRALGTDPTLVALRRATCLQTYAANDPDFRHRFAGKNPETNPDGPFNSVYLRGKTAMCVVDRDGGLVWWLQGGSYRQYAADIERQGVLEEVQLSGMGILRRPRPRVCTPETCPPGTPPSITPNPTQPDDGPLRPIPSPIDIVETPEDTVPPAAPPVTPTIPGVEDGFVSAELKQMQQQILELKQQIVINQTTQIDYAKIAEEMAKRLTHSATITLLDGSTKVQTKPLNKPLEFVQQTKGLK